jgi:ferredoxin
MDRRNFLKTAATVSAAALPLKDLKADNTKENKEFIGVLVDTTRCIGCRSCEVACSEEHDLYVPDVKNDSALDNIRDTSEKQWTIVNRFETEKGEVFVKKQCMHCWQPACTAACLTKAMNKTKEGPVTWEINVWDADFAWSPVLSIFPNLNITNGIQKFRSAICVMRDCKKERNQLA